jgi:epoxyqueuosine reductase
MRDPTQFTEAVKAWDKELGFQEIGIADATSNMSQSETGLQQWFAEGYDGEMNYMGKQGTPPAEPVPGTLRGISARMNYMPEAKDSCAVIEDGDNAFISRYALGRDATIPGEARTLAEACRQNCDRGGALQLSCFHG